MFIQMLACNVYMMMLSMGSSDCVLNLPDVGLGVIMGFLIYKGRQQHGCKRLLYRPVAVSGDSIALQV